MNAYLKKSLLTHKKYLILNIFATVFTTLTLISKPYVEGQLINVLVYDEDFSNFLNTLIVLFAIILIRLILSYFISRISYYHVPIITTLINDSILKRLFKTEVSSLRNYNSTYLHSRISEDTSMIVSYYFTFFPSMLSNLLTVVSVIGILSIITTPILIAFAFFLLLYIFLYLYTKKHLYDTNLQVRENSDVFFSTRNDIYSRIFSIKAKGTDINEMERLNKRANNMFLSINRDFKWNYFLSTSKISITLVFQVALFLIGGFSVMQGNLTIGIFTIILQYFTLLTGVIESFLSLATDFQSYKVSLDRMNHILNYEQDLNGDKDISILNEIIIKDLNISSQNKHNNMLYKEPLNLHFKKNKVYSLVGENGVGKSTFLMFLIGLLYNKKSGYIYYNNTPLEDIDIVKFRDDKLSIMFQNETFNSITVKEYLYFHIDFEEIKRLSEVKEYKNVFFNDKFNVLSYLDYQIDRLSGGEQQLIFLFGTLTKPNVDLILLDEPFSNIFKEFHSSLMKLIKTIASKEKIVIMVSHDMDIIDHTIKIDIV